MAFRSFKRKRKGRGGRRFVKRTFGRRHFGKHKRRWNPTKLINRRPTLIPDRYFTKLRYVEETAFDTTAGGGAAIYRFRGNSLFDPNETAVGHQPYGFDQLAALWSRYRVYASKITVIWGSNTSTPNLIEMSLEPDTATSAAEDPSVVAERPYVHHKTMTNPATTGRTVKLKGFMGTAKIYGAKKREVEIDDTFSAQVSANPAKQWYWLINIASNSGTGTGGTGFMTVYLTYYCMFWDRLIVGQS